MDHKVSASKNIDPAGSISLSSPLPFLFRHVTSIVRLAVENYPHAIPILEIRATSPCSNTLFEKLKDVSSFETKVDHPAYPATG
jgi:hypothetical protein